MPIKFEAALPIQILDICTSFLCSRSIRHGKGASHYDTLGVAETATLREIKEAFIKKSKEVSGSLS